MSIRRTWALKAVYNCSSKRQFSTSKTQFSKITFTDVISEDLASKSAQLSTLHSRLRLPSSFKLSSLARCLTCHSENGKYPDNIGLSIFGKTLLSYHTTEYFLMKYPRLPLGVLNNAVNSVIGEHALYNIGRSWGIETETRSGLDRYLTEVKESETIGKLRFDPKIVTLENNLTVRSKLPKAMFKEPAMASAVKSIIAAFFASTRSLEETQSFIHNHILSYQLLKIESFFEFDQPTRELAALCRRHSLEAPVSRLLSETGRVSTRPVFLVGVFSGTQKLGESFGASLKEAKIRASVAALTNWYLYTPVDLKLPSEQGYQSTEVLDLVDHGVVIV